MNVEDKIRAIFAIPLGFILGAIGAAVAELASVTSWVVFVVFLMIVAGVFVFNRLGDVASLRLMEALSDRSEAELEKIRERKLVGSHSSRPRYLFVIGIALGVLATLIWSPLEVLRALT